MAVVVPDVGEVGALSAILTAQTIVVHLYTNSVTLGESTVLGDFTEASGSGYAAITLVPGSWTISGGSPSTASYGGTVRFGFTGAGLILMGYYVTANGSLLYAETFTSPLTVTSNGQGIVLTLSFTAA